MNKDYDDTISEFLKFDERFSKEIIELEQDILLLKQNGVSPNGGSVPILSWNKNADGTYGKDKDGRPFIYLFELQFV